MTSQSQYGVYTLIDADKRHLIKLKIFFYLFFPFPVFTGFSMIKPEMPFLSILVLHKYKHLNIIKSIH